jgi:hypothetical protein
VDQKPARDAMAWADFDVVFAVANAAEFGHGERLAACRRLILWPNLIFFGFHPDITYFGIEGKPVRSAMGEYNSRIVATAYALEMDVHETARLFSRAAYEKLGFFSLYAISREALVMAADDCALDLRPAITAWENSGVFMYSINHPKLIVFADLARALLRRAGLPFDPALPACDIVPDFLANGGIWPVYPEIAEALGVAGSLTFTPPAHGTYDAHCLSLEAFIARTFAIYRSDGFLPRHMQSLGGLKTMWNALAA